MNYHFNAYDLVPYGLATVVTLWTIVRDIWRRRNASATKQGTQP
jgi:hypothetical protein